MAVETEGPNFTNLNSQEQFIFLMSQETEGPNFTNLNSQEQFIFLMSQENRVLNYKIISIIHEWFTKRLEYSENLIL